MAGKGSSGARKPAGTRPLSPKKQAELEAMQQRRRRREILGIVFIALGLFFFLSRFPFTGFVGEKLFGFTFGLFGVLANALPIICIAYGVFAIIMASKEYHGAKSALIWGIVITVCSLFHVSQSDRMGDGYINYLVNSFIWGETNMAGGGLFGGLLTYYTAHFFGSGGSYLLFATLLVILVIVLGNLSISKMGEKVGGKLSQTVSQQKVKHDASKEIRMQQRELERRESQRVEMERRRLFEEEMLRQQDAELYYNDLPPDVLPARPVSQEERSEKGRRKRKESPGINFEVGEKPTMQTNADGEVIREGIDVETGEIRYNMPDYDQFYGQQRRNAYYEEDLHPGGTPDLYADEVYGDYGGEDEYAEFKDEALYKTTQYEDDYNLFLPPVDKPKKKRSKAAYVNIELEGEAEKYGYENVEDIDVFIPPALIEEENRIQHPNVEHSKIVPFPYGKKPGNANPESFANYDLGEEGANQEPRVDESRNRAPEVMNDVHHQSERLSGDRFDPAPQKDIKETKRTESTRSGNQSYKLPSYNLLNQVRAATKTREDLPAKRQKLQQTLHSFGVDAKVTGYYPGPVITRFEVQLAPGVRMNKLVNLANDIAMNMAVQQVRIAPIPGKAAIGIEVPNAEAMPVTLRELLETPEFQRSKSDIAVALGKDIGGKPVIIDISKMPHLLIAGSTGSGKSVCINTILCSFLYKSTPEDLKLILVDPKVVELALYRKMPHLLVPVVTRAQKAASALNRSVSEMEERYRLFEEHGVREIERYNEIARQKDYATIPKLVIVIDELADLMMVSPREVEDAIIRIAQKGRAAGIHLIVATQRPSSDIITGLIKSNIPSRIAFAVASGTDSRIILDTNGAEKLLGKGDMLYLPIGASQPVRMQGALVTDGEIEKLQDFFLQQGFGPNYDEGFAASVEEGEGEEASGGKADKANSMDELLPEVVEKLMQNGQASTSMIQRRFRIGYTRAARIMDQMEEQGIVSAQDGSKPRNILFSREDFEMMFGYPPDIPPLGT